MDKNERLISPTDLRQAFVDAKPDLEAGYGTYALRESGFSRRLVYDIISKLPTADLWRSVDDPPESDMICIVYDAGYYYVAYYKSEQYIRGFYIDGEQSTSVYYWMPLFEISEDKKKIADEQEKERERIVDLLCEINNPPTYVDINEIQKRLDIEDF